MNTFWKVFLALQLVRDMHVSLRATGDSEKKSTLDEKKLDIIIIPLSLLSSFHFISVHV